MELGFWVSWRDVAELGSRRLVEDLYSCGVSMVSLFVVSGGNVFFEPKYEYFKESPLKPVKGIDRDLLREFVAEAEKAGLKTTATIVCVVDPVHSRADPSITVVDVHGRRHSYGLCPSNSKVRKYIASLARNVASEYDVDEIELDYVRYKRSRDETLLPLHLYAGRYCYCERCLRSAEEEGIDVEDLLRTVKEIMEISRVNEENARRFFQLYTAGGDIAGLYSRSPQLSQWLKMRSKNVAGLVSSARESIRDSGVKLSADLFYPAISWQVGQDYTMLGDHLDTAKPMAYTASMGLWETRYVRRLMDRLGGRFEGEFARYLSALMGYDIGSISDFEYRGAPPHVAYRETVKAKTLLPGGTEVLTGLYSIHDPKRVYNPSEVFARTVEHAAKGGADGIYFFSYRHTPESHKKVVKEFSESLR